MLLLHSSLGDNCIQNFHGGGISSDIQSEVEFYNMISDRISDDIPPQMKNLNMVIPILMYFCSLILNWRVASHIRLCIIVIIDIKQF